LKYDDRVFGEGRMLRKTVSRMILFMLFLSMFTLAFNIQQVKAEPDTIYVDDDNTTGPWNGTSEYPYQNITSGLENAQAGDTVIVKSGTYAEGQIDVNKSLTLEANGAVIVDGLQENHVFNITANHTTLKGFTVKNSTSSSAKAAIYLHYVQNCTIENNKALDSWCGIYLWHSTNNTLIDNEACPVHDGIWLRWSSNNTLIGNKASGNGEDGIAICHSNRNKLINNTASDNYQYGIELDHSNYTIVLGNVASNNVGSGGDYLEFGIKLQSLANCIIKNNNFSDNNKGIMILASSNNTIYHNNFIDNDLQAWCNVTGNKWDNGYPSGGNYWSDYDGTDLPLSDGIGRTPYVINENNQDNYPLTSPHVHDVAIMEVTVSPTEVYSGKNVSISVVAKNEGVHAETFNVATKYDNNVIDTKTVTDLSPENETTLVFTWDTNGVSKGSYTIKAEASVVPSENKTSDNTYDAGTVQVTRRMYMQNDKWDSTWKLFWNNTITSTHKTISRFEWHLYGELGVKIYNGTVGISDGVVKVGRWYNLQSCLKSTTWDCDEHNVTGTYIKIEVYYKFAGCSWQNMGVAFKTETFTENTILNATEWTIYLYGEFHMEWGPLGAGTPPGQNRAAITFIWGSNDEKSRVDDIVFTFG